MAITANLTTMRIRDPHYMLIIGTSSLALAILIGVFGGDNSALNFLEGLFLGVSLAMNVTYILILRKARVGA